MNVNTTPRFTGPAQKLWLAVPAETQKLLLGNVWCGTCRHEVTITNYTGTVRSGALLLVGKCAECHGDVARVIEAR
jgi:uncharacterized CHY-type Zn-finger protein